MRNSPCSKGATAAGAKAEAQPEGIPGIPMDGMELSQIWVREWGRGCALCCHVCHTNPGWISAIPAWKRGVIPRKGNFLEKLSLAPGLCQDSLTLPTAPWVPSRSSLGSGHPLGAPQTPNSIRAGKQGRAKLPKTHLGCNSLSLAVSRARLGTAWSELA